MKAILAGVASIVVLPAVAVMGLGAMLSASGSTVPTGCPSASPSATPSTLSSPPGPGASASPDPCAGIAGYVNPLPDPQWGTARTDQGVDFIPTVPLPVLAIGDGIVTYSSTSCGWPGGAFIAYQLTNGSHAGLYVFVAEHLTDLLPVGTVLHAGDPVAVGWPGYPWIETGWATPHGDSPAVPYNGLPDGTPTAGGLAFARFLNELGRTTAQDPGPGPDRP